MSLVRTLTGQSHRSRKSSNASTGGAVTQTITTNTQSGVLNHLNSEQNDKLVEFKERLQKDGWWSPDAVNGRPTHDDGTLL